MAKFRLRSWRALAARVRGLIAGQPVNKMGIQFQVDDGEVLRYNREIRPRSWKSINVLKRDFLLQLKADNPGALGILRLHPDSDWQPEPERRAEEHIERIRREAGSVLDLFGAVEDNNEYIHAHHPDEMVQDADRYMERFIQLCEPELGLKPVVLNAATGNWGDDIAKFVRMLLALQRFGGYLGFHEYDWPMLWRAHEEGIAAGNEGMWHALRWKRAARAAKGFLDGWCPKFIITEVGLERAVIPGSPHGGFLDLYPDDREHCIRQVTESMAWYYQQLDDDVDSVIWFGCGMVTPWERFDIKGESAIYEAIKSFPTVVIPPEPEPEPEPPPSEPEEPSMEIKVIDLEYNERDFEYAQAKYGVAFRRAEVASGQKVYRLIELWEKTGTSGLGTQVLDEGGRPMANVDVAFYWPDAPDPPDPPTQVYGHDWYRNFVHGPTNANGDIAPGMGKGAYHGRGEGGPHAVWVRDPMIPSDICEKLGMLAGTFHDHLDQKFQLQIEGEGTTPSPGGGKSMFREKSRQFIAGVPAQIHLHLSGGTDSNYFNIRGDLGCPGWQLPDAVDPIKEGELGARFEFGCMYGESVARTYTAWVFNLATMERVSDEVVCPFDANPDLRGKWDVYLEWTTAPSPEPEPEPPTGSPAAQIRQVADEVRDKLYGVAAGLEAGGVTGGRLILRLADDSEVEFNVTPKVGASVMQRLGARIRASLMR